MEAFIDMNDRVLRNVVVGLGAKADGVVREDHFVILDAFTLLQPCAMFANGPPCTSAGVCSSVWITFGLWHPLTALPLHQLPLNLLL